MFEMCLWESERYCSHDCFIEGNPCPMWRKDGLTYREYIDELLGYEDENR